MQSLIGMVCLVALAASAPSAAPAVDEVVAAFEARRTKAALRQARALLAADGPVESMGSAHRVARVVEVFALRRLKRLQEARGSIEILRREGPPMGPYLEAMYVQALALEKECELAEAVTQGLPPTSTFVVASWSRVASCWLRRNEGTRASAAVARFEEAAFSDSARAAAGLMRGRVWEFSQSPRKARDSYRQVVVQFALTAGARAAGQRLEKLRKAGTRVSPLTPAEKLTIADQYRGRQRILQAKRLYRQVQGAVRSKKAPLYLRAELGLAEIDIVDRTYPGAQKRIDGVLKNAVGSVRARGLYLKADVLSRRGRLTSALATYDTLIEGLPDETFTGEGALAAARLAYGARNYGRAQTYARWILEKAGGRAAVSVVGDDGVHRRPETHGTLKDHALWLLGWIERRQGATDAVVESYLAQIDTDGALGPDALYWRARLAAMRQDTAQAQALAGMLTDRAPVSFSGLAVSTLVTAGASSAPVVPALLHGPRLDVERPSVALSDLMGPMALFDYGLQTEARAALRTLSVNQLTPADRLAAAWLYRQCGELHRGALLTRSVAEAIDSNFNDPAIFELAYPRPFAEVVHKNAHRYDVPADLIYAVMREESAFNPRAQSPRSARGLMQMIKPTAKRMAADARLKRFRLQQLYQPEIAVRLGTHYLAKLLEQFEGNLVAAVAAYHAGEAAVARWLRTRRALAPDEFIEDIPYDSTRHYVKKVLGSYGMYRLLYDARGAALKDLHLAAPDDADSEEGPEGAATHAALAP